MISDSVSKKSSLKKVWDSVLKKFGIVKRKKYRIQYRKTLVSKQARKARKTRTSPGTLSLKKFGLGKL